MKQFFKNELQARKNQTNIMKTRFIVAIVSIVFFSSCQKETVENLMLEQATPTTTSNLNELGADCNAAPYYPICDSSVFNYSEKGGGLFTSLTVGKNSGYTLRVLSDTTIDNNIYKKARIANGDIAYYDCQNGVVTQLMFYANQTPSDVKTTIMKSNEPVGAMWRDTFNISNTIKEYYEYTIMEKGTSRGVGGIFYDDIIKLKKNTFVSENGVVSSTNNYLELFYARGTGLIEIKSINTVGNGAINYHRILTSAFIPE